MYYGSFNVNMALLAKAINDFKWGCKSILALYNEIRKTSSNITLKLKALPVKVSNIYKLLSLVFLTSKFGLNLFVKQGN